MTNPLKQGQSMMHLRPHHFEHNVKINGITLLTENAGEHLGIALSICSLKDPFNRKLGVAQVIANNEAGTKFVCSANDWSYLFQDCKYDHDYHGIVQALCDLSWSGRLHINDEHALLQLHFLSTTFGFRIDEGMQAAACALIEAQRLKAIEELPAKLEAARIAAEEAQKARAERSAQAKAEGLAAKAQRQTEGRAAASAA